MQTWRSRSPSARQLANAALCTHTSQIHQASDATMKVRPSMGSVGDAYDNAMAESFFATLECELIDRRSWLTKAQARLDIFSWIESWYNPQRLHSGLGYLSPAEFERRRKNIQQNATEPAHQIINRESNILR